MGVTDHPILMPTSRGPVGGVVSEPAGVERGALILFQSGGPAARCGVNAIWTRIAHELAAEGLLVLRFDFATEGDSAVIGMDASREPGWRSTYDMPVTREVASWFRTCSGREIMVAGSCYGARLALELASEDAGVSGAFLVTPYLSGVRRSKRGAPAAPRVAVAVRPDLQQGVHDPVSAVTVDAAATIVDRGCPLWILTGEKDGEQALDLGRRVPDPRGRLELEVAPGIALHPGTDAPAQAEIAKRLRRRIALGTI